MAWVDSGAGTTPSALANSTPASNATFCSTAIESISPRCLTWLTSGAMPW